MERALRLSLQSGSLLISHTHVLDQSLPGRAELEVRLARPVTRKRGWENFQCWPRGKNSNDSALHPGRNAILSRYGGVSVDFGNCSECSQYWLRWLRIMMTAFQADCLKESTRQILFMLLAFHCAASSEGDSLTFSVVSEWALMGLHVSTGLWFSKRCWTRKACVSNSSMDTVRGKFVELAQEISALLPQGAVHILRYQFC